MKLTSQYLSTNGKRRKSVMSLGTEHHIQSISSSSTFLLHLSKKKMNEWLLITSHHQVWITLFIYYSIHYYCDKMERWNKFRIAPFLTTHDSLPHTIMYCSSGCWATCSGLSFVSAQQWLIFNRALLVEWPSGGGGRWPSFPFILLHILPGLYKLLVPPQSKNSPRATLSIDAEPRHTSTSHLLWLMRLILSGL